MLFTISYNLDYYYISYPPKILELAVPVELVEFIDLGVLLKLETFIPRDVFTSLFIKPKAFIIELFNSLPACLLLLT